MDNIKLQVSDIGYFNFDIKFNGEPLNIDSVEASGSPDWKEIKILPDGSVMASGAAYHADHQLTILGRKMLVTFTNIQELFKAGLTVFNYRPGMDLKEEIDRVNSTFITSTVIIAGSEVSIKSAKAPKFIAVDLDGTIRAFESDDVYQIGGRCASVFSEEIVLSGFSPSVKVAELAKYWEKIYPVFKFYEGLNVTEAVKREITKYKESAGVTAYHKPNQFAPIFLKFKGRTIWMSRFKEEIDVKSIAIDRDGSMYAFDRELDEIVKSDGFYDSKNGEFCYQEIAWCDASLIITHPNMDWDTQELKFEYIPGMDLYDLINKL